MYDLIVIGCGSGGLTVGLFMAEVGNRVLMVSKTEHDIGGECLNDGCVPSKALLHLSRIAHFANLARELGFDISGMADPARVFREVHSRQEIVRRHENLQSLREKGIEVALGEAGFTGKNEIAVNGKKFRGRKIVIATGSSPKKLNVPGIELVNYLDNQHVFETIDLPARLLVVGAGPIGMEMAQAYNRLGCKVTVIDEGSRILIHDEESVTAILTKQLENEGISFHFSVKLEKFSSSRTAIVKQKEGQSIIIDFDTVFVAIGRELVLEPLRLSAAGIETKNNKIVADGRLRTTNKNVFVCGDIAGNLQFSHAAEFHGRIIINNFFSPIKKNLSDDPLSWVTFTDPELASFGLSEQQLKEKKISFLKLEQDFDQDERAIVENYRYGKLILYISPKTWFGRQKILGGTMVAPHAGELIQELILARNAGIAVNDLFNKVYPYPVAARINQKIIVAYKQDQLTGNVKKILRFLYRIC